MGRHDKPHLDMHLRFDAAIYRRLKAYVEQLNKSELKRGKRCTTMTDIVEEAVFLYLNEKENF